MKRFKRIVIILVIAAFAIIAGSIKTDFSCEYGAGASFPFSLLTKIFEKDEIPVVDAIQNIADEGLPLIGSSVAFAQKKAANIKVVFIELGSVNCIPCKMMQPVMQRIEQKYSSQVKVIFHDVWTEKGAPFARIYKVRAIPTQVYVDSAGKEFFRHEGFHSFEEVEKILKRGGVK